MLCSAICMNSIAHVGMAAIAATNSRRDCRQVSAYTHPYVQVSRTSSAARTASTRGRDVSL